jgi:hypothetical protein
VACYVDRLIDYTDRVPYRHKVWCHLVADSDEELLACAAELGLSEAWMQGTRGWDSHFDLPAPLRPGALAIGARSVDFRFMGRRTRARRAALKLGGDQAVGAPAGVVVEVPLPPGDWGVLGAPRGVEVGWRADHPLLADRPVVTLAAPGELAGVVTLAEPGVAAAPAGSAGPGAVHRVALVLTATARDRDRSGGSSTQGEG